MNRTVELAFAVASLGLSAGLTGLALALPSPAHAGPYQTVSRDYPWSSDHLTLDVPADVRFRRGPTWHLTIRGPEHTLDRLVVDNGRIGAKEHGCLSLIPFCMGFGTHIEHAVDVEITGPALRRVTINASDTLDLAGLKQDRLTVTVNGSGAVKSSGTVDETTFDIEGSGTVVLDGLHQNRLTALIGGSGSIAGSGTTDDLRADISGSGTLRLAQVRDTNARVSVSGSGDVYIAPTDRVSVGVSGSGHVYLHSHPRSLTLHVSGSGGVTELPAGQAPVPAK